MAINVWLTVFKKADAAMLRSKEWMYLLVNYGATFIVALVCCFISDERGKIYGPSALWCSISQEWAFLRIVLVYAPAWYVFSPERSECTALTVKGCVLPLLS